MVTTEATNQAAPTLMAQNWESVRQAFEDADRALNTYDRDRQIPAAALLGLLEHRGLKSGNPDWDLAWKECRQTEDRFADLCGIQTDALQAVLDYPSYSLLVLAYKLEVILADKRWEHADFKERLESLLHELRGFVGMESAWQLAR